MDKEYCNKDSLGKPLPDCAHAVSVSLPRWKDVVGYEESQKRVLKSVKSGYPRFILHPITKKFFKLCEKKFAEENEFCMAFPSEKSATQCLDFVKLHSGKAGRIYPYGKQNVYVVSLPDSTLEKAKEFWQHVGVILPSRQAEALLKGHKTPKNTAYKEKTKERIAKLSGEKADNIYLFPSGMSAIHTIYQSICRLFPERKTIQLGFPYVDTLKIQEKCGYGVRFLEYHNTDDLAALERVVKEEKISGVFCEFPGNPLLQSVELDKLSAILKKHKIPLIIDDTIATWHNVDLSAYADVIVTSLTKFFSGEGDVLAGSLIINSKSAFYADLKESVDSIYEDILYGEDALILEKNSRDFSERMKKINKSAEELCDYLHSHPKIESVYYPKYITVETYLKYKKTEGGFGGLFSVILKDRDKTPDFYDNIEVAKGPGLGTNFTLVCPYTLLAHYHELDFAKSCGVEPELVRVSVGLEKTEDLIKRFEKALRE